MTMARYLPRTLTLPLPSAKHYFLPWQYKPDSAYQQFHERTECIVSHGHDFASVEHLATANQQINEKHRRNETATNDPPQRTLNDLCQLYSKRATERKKNNNNNNHPLIRKKISRRFRHVL